MLSSLVMIVLIALIAILVFATTRPDTFRVKRSTRIRAAPEKIFPLIDDFRQWRIWSPWEKMDPAQQRTFSGSANGKGAIYEWSGNKKVGQGRMEILESTPSSRILIKLDFIKPFEGHNTAEFTLTPQDDGIQLDWAMYGPSPYISKLMGIFFNMDQMIGKDFEAGLTNLKSAAEK